MTKSFGEAKMGISLLDYLTNYCHIVETDNEYWHFERCADTLGAKRAKQPLPTEGGRIDENQDLSATA